MVPEIISFRKSIACRLQEFQSLLSDIETPCSEINEVWTSTFHDLCILKVGWLALWIVSEENCIDYNLIHPTAVIVKVDQYDFDDMCAVVSVVAVQDDTSLPLHLKVPLTELHPIKNQEFDMNDLKIIANWLDKSRFFFRYLWYPWDAKENVKLSQWCATHLEDRLKIQCDIQNGVFERKVAHYYKSLVKESWEIEDSLNEQYSEELTKTQRIDIINNCIRRKILKLELAFFEDPESRDDLISFRLKKPAVKEKKIARFVWNGGDMDSLISHLNSAKLQTDDDAVVKVSPSFQEALDSSNPGEIILLSPGTHFLKSLMGLQLGGIIRVLTLSVHSLTQSALSELPPVAHSGLEEPSRTEVLADGSGVRRAILFECFGDFSFKNVTIKQQQGIAIQISEKSLKISNCRITGRKHPGTRGIVVLSGSALILENCEIEGFGIGLAALKGARVSVSNCLIHDCLGGIKVTNESWLSMKDTEISDCSEYAIRLESSETNTEVPLTGEIDLLRNYCNSDSKFDIESVVFKNNLKCNVLIEKNLDKFNSCVFDTDVFNESNPKSEDNLSD